MEHNRQYEITKEYEDPSCINTDDHAFMVHVADMAEYIFHKNRYDLYEDTYHNNLLDTDKNRRNLTILFEKTFPGARIFSFKSHVDGNQYRLRISGKIPWTAIEAMHDKMVKSADEMNMHRNGNYYRRICEIREQITAKTGKKRTQEICGLEAELASLKKVTKLWDAIAFVKMDNTAHIQRLIEIKHDGRMKIFTAGTSLRTISSWFAKTFHINVKDDLIGDGQTGIIQ